MPSLFGTVMAFFRRGVSGEKIVPDPIEPDAPDEAITVDDGIVDADIARRLAAMPVFVRETYLLRIVDRMSVEQIADRLAISKREVRKNLRQAIALLMA